MRISDWSSDVCSSDLTFDGNRLTALTPGAFDATASFAGKTAVKDLTAIAGIAADEIAPIAEITSPAPGEEIATELTVTGIATDANLTGWLVSVIDASGAELAEVARGTAPISNTPFGALATAALPPGIVTIRLDVEDAGGNISRTDVPVNVLEGPQPGAFSLSMTDLTVPMPGLSPPVDRKSTRLNSSN